MGIHDESKNIGNAPHAESEGKDQVLQEHHNPLPRAVSGRSLPAYTAPPPGTLPSDALYRHPPPGPNLLPNPPPFQEQKWGRESALPTGTVTFLFTDIQGSTPLWEGDPEKMAEALQIHNSALRQAIEAHDGAVFKTVGDAFQAAFATAPQALKAAIEGQQALRTAAWNELGELKVRMGLHTGEAELDPGGDEYAVSHAKNRIGRIHSAAHGRQILLSQETANLVVRKLPEGVFLKDLGEHRLKGMTVLEHLYQVCMPGLPQEFPPLATAITHPNNLPIQLTSFIGRGKEIAEIKRLVSDASVRLITLTGAGGTGKTRLSLQVAADSLDDFSDGVFFVPLASIADPTLVLSTIAVVLNVRESAGKSLLNSLKAYLRGKHLLLLLDNFEQVSAAAPMVGDLLSSAPTLKVMVTSREILHVYGEYDYPVPVLSIPNTNHLPPLDDLTKFEAVQLFIQRARAAKPDFIITEANAPAIAELCCRMDGLPLAIELAAAHVRLLPPEALLTRLKNRLLLLTGGSRNLPTRQQTLRNTIAWSYDLLNIDEQKLFAHMSVFIGGFTLEAAEAVCLTDNDGLAGVIDGLEALVDKSLLRQEALDHDARFMMLETIHEYASEKLLESGDAESIRRRHANFFLTLAETARPFLEKADQAIWLGRLDREHANLRAALGWVIEDEPIKKVWLNADCVWPGQPRP